MQYIMKALSPVFERRHTKICHLIVTGVLQTVEPVGLLSFKCRDIPIINDGLPYLCLLYLLFQFRLPKSNYISIALFDHSKC